MTLKQVMDNRSLHVVSKAIYCYLYCSIVEENKKIIPITDICESLKISSSTFYRHIKEVIEKTTVKVTQTYMDGRFYHNTYTIEGVGNIDEHQQEQPKKNKTKSTHSSHSKGELASQFQELWDLYPRKQGKKDAFEKFKRVIRDGSATVAEIRDGINRYIPYAKKKGPKFTLMGSTFFNQERWQDQWEMNEFESWYVTEGKRLKEKQQKDYIEISYNEI